MGRPYTCPYCKSTDTVSKGHRRTKGLGLRSIRRCRACKRKFTPKHQNAAQPTDVQGSEGVRQPAAPKPAMAEPQPQARPAEAASPDGIRT